MTTLGDQQREDPDNYVRKVDAALILAPPFQPLDALATGVNLGFGAGLYDPYSRIGFKPVAQVIAVLTGCAVKRFQHQAN